jgi:hypothetical protein
LSNLEERGWAAMIFPCGPAAAEIIGAVRGSKRLHWTLKAARAEADKWVEELKIGPIRWSILDDQFVIGRNTSHVVILRSVLLPLGAAPEFMRKT